MREGPEENAKDGAKPRHVRGQPQPVADLLVMERNPLEDVAVLDTPEKSVLAVMKNGRVYTSRWEELRQDVRAGQPLGE